MTVTFEEISHTYAVDGKLVELCVSDVLELAGISGYSDRVPRYLIEHAGQIGTAVHKACHFLDLDELDIDTVDPQIAGYVMGYHKFCQQYEPRWESMEQPLADIGLGVAGTPDRIGKIILPKSGNLGIAKIKESSVVQLPDFGNSGDVGNLVSAIIDIKTAVKAEKHWGLQLTAYAILSYLSNHALYALHLTREGEFELLPYVFQPGVFMAALTVAQWKKQNKKK